MKDTHLQIKDQLIRAKAYLSFAADKVIIMGSHCWDFFSTGYGWIELLHSFMDIIPLELLFFYWLFFFQFYNLNICFRFFRFMSFKLLSCIIWDKKVLIFFFVVKVV
ncbi:hypothetical protein HanXRQr2_Chr12g0557411 [Helianthus annuus]|uniref:Uncharacterized protein n=1 Tax=Helianthus annuus TaxID=4232 RepID=A0A9K3MXE5_HELAN|nr:hypothetical protein HanXRQr2_Chr12g0557411 [Helianthus annuus]KAJ0864001.1 hypothetical protein HanPSC8_Chr12g0536621 [Helianthus annuus]